MALYFLLSESFYSEEKAITACDRDDRSVAVWQGWGELYPVMDVESCIEVIYNSRRQIGEGCRATPCGIIMLHDARAKQVTWAYEGVKMVEEMTLLTPPRQTSATQLGYFMSFQVVCGCMTEFVQVVAFWHCQHLVFEFCTLSISRSTLLFSKKSPSQRIKLHYEQSCWSVSYVDIGPPATYILSQLNSRWMCLWLAPTH